MRQFFWAAPSTGGAATLFLNNPLLGKYNRPATGIDNPVLQMGFYGAGQYSALNILADPLQFIRIILVRDPFHILFNYRSFIQVGGSVMGGRADHFHTALPGATIRISALEPGQKRMMNINYPSVKMLYEIR